MIADDALKSVVPVPVEVTLARNVYSNPCSGAGRVKEMALLLVVWVMLMIESGG